MPPKKTVVPSLAEQQLLKREKRRLQRQKRKAKKLQTRLSRNIPTLNLKGSRTLAKGMAQTSALVRGNLSVDIPIVASIALPYEYPPSSVKMSYSDASPVASNTTFLTEVQSQTSSLNGDLSICPPGEIVHLITRDITRIYGRTVQVDNYSAMVYNVKFEQSANVTPKFTMPACAGVNGSNNEGPVSNSFVPFAWAEHFNSDAIHGETLYATVNGGIKYIWLNVLEELRFSLTIPSTATAMTSGNIGLKMFYFDGSTYVTPNTDDSSIGGVIAVNLQLAGLGPGLHTFTPLQAPASGYYCVEISLFEIDNDALDGNGNPGAEIRCDLQGPGSAPMTRVWGWLSVIDLIDNMNSVQDCCVPAVSILLTNTSPVLNVNGQMVLAQFPQNTNWGSTVQQFVTADGDWYTTVSSFTSATTKVQAALNGGYAFMKPEIDSFSLRAAFRHRLDGTVMGTATSAKLGQSIIVVTKTTATDTSLFGGNIWQVTVTNHLLFHTTSQWFYKCPPQYSMDELKEACEAISVMPQFYENPTHMREVLSKIWSIFRTGLKLAPAVAAAVSAVQPELAPVAAPIGATAAFLNRNLGRYGY